MLSMVCFVRVCCVASSMFVCAFLPVFSVYFAASEKVGEEGRVGWVFCMYLVCVCVRFVSLKMLFPYVVCFASMVYLPTLKFVLRWISIAPCSV